MTVFSSGISMYAMAKLIMLLRVFDAPVLALGLPRDWIFHASIILSALIVLGYVYLGGLTSAIYNEVLQFFLIVAGFLPLVLLGLKNVGGWSGLQATFATMNKPAFTHTWVGMEHASTNPLGVEWFGLVMGLGFVLSFGYWCTDFLVIQRAMSAESMTAARRTPILAAIPKMLFPGLVILPGMIAIALHTSRGGLLPLGADGTPNYNLAVPVLLAHYLPSGLLGLGLTALMASFMSGMAGNVTAFNTVWTYDIYQSYIRPGQSDRHYLRMGHTATVVGIVLSVAAAYATTRFNNIMDMLQLVFAFVNAPLFATFLLGMFWRRATGHGAFFGLLSGTAAAAIHHGLTLPRGAMPGLKGAFLGTALHVYPSEMAQNFWTAIFAWTTCFVATIAISLVTARDKSDAELGGLVYSLTPRQTDGELVWYKRPATLGVIALGLTLVLNIIFW
jgi:SSS family solute:Na+ symporter